MKERVERLREEFLIRDEYKPGKPRPGILEKFRARLNNPLK